MATHGETRNQTSSMPGRKPSFSRSIGQSLSAAFGKKDGYYFEIEFLSDTASHHLGEKKQMLVDYVEIGRSSNCAVKFKGEGVEAKVSGKHASITRNGGEWTLEHLSKTNSTIINGGSRVIRPEDSFKKYVLQDGDTIQLAKGGPVVRFVVPKENSMQSLRGKSRGTTFIRNIVSQAIAPYKRTINTLIGIIVALAVLWAAYAVYEHIHHQKVVGDLQEKLDKNNMERAEEVSGLRQAIEEQEVRQSEEREALQKQIKEQAAQLSAQRRQLDRVSVSTREPGIDEMMANQNLAADVFFIVAKTVVVFNGEEVEIPYYYRDESGRVRKGQYGWTATGFLLNDGRFVTARHCVEGWWYAAYNDTNSFAQYARLSATRNDVKIKTYMTAHSSKSGRSLSFTSDQFHIDRSKDHIETIATAEDGTAIKWRFVFPAMEGWDPTMFATDWAWVQTQHTGTLEADASLSISLASQQKLLVMGFPKGLGVESASRIEPISYQMNVTQPGISSNGCIMHSTGTDRGNSGGPIFAVKNGKLVVVGIVSRGDERSSLYNWAVPISRIGNR